MHLYKTIYYYLHSNIAITKKSLSLITIYLAIIIPRTAQINCLNVFNVHKQVHENVTENGRERINFKKVE